MTGQLFATRIAIGLAVPSPQALQKTGGILARGIQQIVGQAQAAQGGSGRVVGEYRNTLNNINKLTMSAATKMNNEMNTLLSQNLNQMNKLSGGAMAKSFNETAGSYSRLKKILAAPIKSQLDKGMGGLSGIAAMTKQTQNLYEMGAANRKEVIASAQQVISLKRDEVEMVTKDVNQMSQKTDEEREAYNIAEEGLRIKKEQLKEDEKHLKNLTRQVAEADKMDTLSARMLRRQKEWSASIIGAGNAIRSKFNDALRTTAMLLTAVGYKLSQNTRELIEYEKELLNANSVFNLTNDSLFKVSNSILEFGNEFGIAAQNGASGLYQLASAGLSADEAMKVLPSTLKLSMAVQGDHNTISKLTAQTLFGFGMEMNEAALITDKFAFAIQKSLIEYQDLSSAVKFALPFFTSTGQSIDQLLGALQILTNRALEAGIAGRGLRQALAEFAESAMDAEVGFRKMGVEILNSQGEMLQLSEIAAQFAEAVGPTTISNTELLTTLIQDLNVRGATAFIHLVQASDEFTQAVEDTANAGGQLDEMVKIQNESLSAQIQILKTNVLSIFAFRDAAYEGTEFMNGFHEAVVSMVTGFRELIIEGEGADQQLTEFGMNLQSMAVKAVIAFGKLADAAVGAVQAIADNEEMLMSLFGVMVKFMTTIANVVNYAATTSVPLLNMSLLELYATLKLISMVVTLGALGKFAKGAYKLGTGAAALVSGAGARAAVNKAGVALTQAGSKRVINAGVARGALTMGVRVGAGLTAAGTGIGTALLAYEALKLLDSSGVVDVPMIGKANGGYMERGVGGPVMVGEQGPELFMPGQSGQVLNNAQTNNIMGSGVTFRNVTIGIDSFGGIA